MSSCITESSTEELTVYSEIIKIAAANSVVYKFCFDLQWYKIYKEYNT